MDEVKDTDSEHLGLPTTFAVDSVLSLEQELEELLVLFRLYLRASFKVCNKAFTALEEMGFEPIQINQALRYTGNNLPEAVSK